jgi:hypothetical protein
VRANSPYLKSSANDDIAEDGPTVFAHACRLGAEGIVSKRVDDTYRSGPRPAWIKVRNLASIAVQRERSENWKPNKRLRRNAGASVGVGWLSVGLHTGPASPYPGSSAASHEGPGFACLFAQTVCLIA